MRARVPRSNHGDSAVAVVVGARRLALQPLASSSECVGVAASHRGHEIPALGREQPQDHRVRAEQLARLVGDRLQDPVELLQSRDLRSDVVEGPDFAHLLLERIVRAAHLALVLLQRVRHGVERLGEEAELVLVVDCDPSLEAALGYCAAASASRCSGHAMLRLAANPAMTTSAAPAMVNTTNTTTMTSIRRSLLSCRRVILSCAIRRVLP